MASGVRSSGMLGSLSDDVVDASVVGPCGDKERSCRPELGTASVGITSSLGGVPSWDTSIAPARCVLVCCTRSLSSPAR